MRKANYDKFPSTKFSGTIIQGWDAILAQLKRSMQGHVLCIDTYTGVYETEIINAFSGMGTVINTRDLMKSESEIRQMTDSFMTDDVLFGYVTNLKMADFFCQEKLQAVSEQLSTTTDTIIIIGIGACQLATADALKVYVDMARWEIQQRFRRHEVMALGVDNIITNRPEKCLEVVDSGRMSDTILTALNHVFGS